MANNQTIRNDRECRKKARKTLADLEKVRQMLRQDRRLSVFFIKPFVLYQIYKAERNIRKMM